MFISKKENKDTNICCILNRILKLETTGLLKIGICVTLTNMVSRYVEISSVTLISNYEKLEYISLIVVLYLKLCKIMTTCIMQFSRAWILAIQQTWQNMLYIVLTTVKPSTNKDIIRIRKKKSVVIAGWWVTLMQKLESIIWHMNR